MRTLRINTPISAVFWTFQRIFAIGTDDVTEFHDSNDYKEQINQGKIWLQCHEGDILCASIRAPDAIVTTCSCGDLIFWRYETGHPYLRFNLKNPTCRLQIVYHQNIKKKRPRGEMSNNKNPFDDNNNNNNDMSEKDDSKGSTEDYFTKRLVESHRF